MSYYNDLHDGNIPGTEESEVAVKDDGGGIQPHSKGESYPWVHTYVENRTEGLGKHYYIHPDGRETQHRKFDLAADAQTPEGCEGWGIIAYRLAEEDAKDAIARDKQKPVVSGKTGAAVRTSGTLENGAEIIAQVGVVVLAKYGHEYVTWLVDAKLNASAGHYFPGNGKAAQSSDLVDAMNDFGERVHAWYEHVI